MLKSDDSPLTKRFRDYSLQLHARRLEEIKTRGSPGIDNSVPRTKEFMKPCNQCKAFRKQEQNKSIVKQNQNFTKILEEISAGKRESATLKILNSAKDESQRNKSLNKERRRKEMRKITRDNEMFAKRIQDAAAEVSYRKLQEEWATVSKYKDSIVRKTPRYSSTEIVNTSVLPKIGEKTPIRKTETWKKERRDEKKCFTQTQQIFDEDKLLDQSAEEISKQSRNKERYDKSENGFSDTLEEKIKIERNMSSSVGHSSKNLESRKIETLNHEKSDDLKADSLKHSDNESAINSDNKNIVKPKEFSNTSEESKENSESNSELNLNNPSKDLTSSKAEIPLLKAL
jgi:hypothetical protein